MEGKEAVIEGKEASKMNSCPDYGVEGVVESGPSQEENGVGGDGIDRVDPLPSEGMQVIL